MDYQSGRIMCKGTFSPKIIMTSIMCGILICVALNAFILSFYCVLLDKAGDCFCLFMCSSLAFILWMAGKDKLKEEIKYGKGNNL